MRPLRRAAAALGCAALLGGTLVLPATSASATGAHAGSHASRARRRGAGSTGRSPASPRRAPCCVTARRSSVGLDPAPIKDALAQIAGWEEPSGTTHPLYAGAVTLLGSAGRVVAREASGYALRYADGAGTELPRDQWVPMRDDTIFDMASVTKLFTSILVLQQVERGAIRLEEPVATYLPEFAAHGKGAITVRQLLTHTSGLRPGLPLWRDWPDRASRIAAVLDVAPTSPPGTTYVYSDLNLITLGVLLERQTGSTLDELVASRITRPLGMRDTELQPGPVAQAPDRGDRVRVRAAARHGVGRGARRERLVPRRRRRPRRHLLHRARHGGPRAGDAQRGHVRRGRGSCRAPASRA